MGFEDREVSDVADEIQMSQIVRHESNVAVELSQLCISKAPSSTVDPKIGYSGFSGVSPISSGQKPSSGLKKVHKKLASCPMSSSRYNPTFHAKEHTEM